jgi:hypothetical protein
MNQNNLISSQQAVLSTLHKNHLTSSQILKKAENILHILRLYSVLDELRIINVVDSYVEKNVKYHYTL